MILRRLHRGRLGTDDATRLLEDARAAAPTYEHVGSTLDPGAWPHRSVRTRSRVVGHGRGAFELAAGRLGAWAPQRHLGAEVVPERAVIEAGTTALVALRLGLVALVVPVRVVDVIDEPDRFAWAYGTLPGHVERGEEGFEVRLADDGEVTASVSLDAVPAGGVAALVPPATAAAQHLAVSRYLAALAP